MIFPAKPESVVHDDPVDVQVVPSRRRFAPHWSLSRFDPDPGFSSDEAADERTQVESVLRSDAAIVMRGGGPAAHNASGSSAASSSGLPLDRWPPVERSHSDADLVAGLLAARSVCHVSKPVDYSKWDFLDDASEDESSFLTVTDFELLADRNFRIQSAMATFLVREDYSDAKFSKLKEALVKVQGPIDDAVWATMQAGLIDKGYLWMEQGFAMSAIFVMW